MGAPCGVMDQMASALGEAGALLALRCQPAELLPPVRPARATCACGASTPAFATGVLCLLGQHPASSYSCMRVAGVARACTSLLWLQPWGSCRVMAGRTEPCCRKVFPLTGKRRGLSQPGPQIAFGAQMCVYTDGESDVVACSVGGLDYGTVRTGAFMGLRLLSETADALQRLGSYRGPVKPHKPGLANGQAQQQEQPAPIGALPLTVVMGDCRGKGAPHCRRILFAPRSCASLPGSLHA